MAQKILGTKDVFIMSVAANLGPRWIPVAAALGLSSVFFWFLGTILFLLPFSLIVIEFSCAYPQEGGMHLWVKKHLGSGPAFLTAWCYWVNNFFFYPAILTFFITSLFYAFGRPELANDTAVVTSVVILVFWVATFLVLAGLQMSKIVGTLGGMSSALLFCLLITLGAFAFFVDHTSATSFHLGALIPRGSWVENLSSLSLLMFALSGIELIPTLANSIRTPEKVLPKALICVALFLFFAYLFASLAMNVFLSPDEIQKTTGLVSGFEIIGANFGMPYLARIVAASISLGEIGAMMLWILVPAIMFFKDTKRGVLPEFFHTENKKGVPRNALYFQAIIVTGIILCTSLLPSVNLMYQALVLMTTVVFFIPYLLVLVAYIKFKQEKVKRPYRVPGGKVGAFILSGAVFVSLVLAILLSFVPTANVQGFYEILVYESQLIGGVALALGVAWALYRFRKV